MTDFLSDFVRIYRLLFWIDDAHIMPEQCKTIHRFNQRNRGVDLPSEGCV